MSRRRNRPDPRPAKKHMPTDVYAYKDQGDVELSAADERRVLKLKETEEQAKRRWGSKMCNRMDVMSLIEMTIQRNFMPMANRLDTVEMYIKFLELPFYRRWWVRITKVWLKLKLRIVRTDEPESDDGMDAESDDGAGETGASPDPGGSVSVDDRGTTDET